MKKNLWVSYKDGKCDVTLYLGTADKPYNDCDANKLRASLEEFIKEAGVK
jgi:hypothetical protein